jgi:hypothetical protein
VVDVSWSEGILESATLTSLAGESAQLRYGDQRVELKLKKGQRQKWLLKNDKLQSA